ncbi:MAG: hypothetical protein US67_C0077G0002 [Candidatus Woesebacteria bacterium GW2011_GWD1_38_10]|uniref:Uncharacterized protein n=1 Tax=Candidatus Woesebacteria bacterium GW2011_GWD1_38_10 TaxID=1618592 RepID=A0A0G0L1C8_9BACT|nr:MAG: hypothetical protein US67_C0077G0002 [Candidatus Woesebacteria bacterium GW2011_GWD1_38_10]
MKKIILSLFIFSVVFIFSAQSVLAGGDQLVGANATGPAYQNGEIPFTGTGY